MGIKQLKARLSEYVRLARGGEIILVSDRDEVVAQLGPPRYEPGEPGSLDAKLERLAALAMVFMHNSHTASRRASCPSRSVLLSGPSA